MHPVFSQQGQMLQEDAQTWLPLVLHEERWLLPGAREKIAQKVEQGVNETHKYRKMDLIRRKREAKEAGRKFKEKGVGNEVEELEEPAELTGCRVGLILFLFLSSFFSLVIIIIFYY